MWSVDRRVVLTPPWGEGMVYLDRGYHMWGDVSDSLTAIRQRHNIATRNREREFRLKCLLTTYTCRSDSYR